MTSLLNTYRELITPLNRKSPAMDSFNFLNERNALAVRLTEQAYRFKTVLGKGTFGTVTLAEPKKGGKLVAIKTLKGCEHINPLDLREVQFFQNVSPHPSIINMSEMYVDSLTRQVNFVLDVMEFNMLGLIHARRGSAMDPALVSSICIQLLQGIAHMHSHDFVHRDIKPENLLLSYDNSKNGVRKIVVKIADFGLSRKVSSWDFDAVWTGYVATRWYRAPEQLLQVPNHGFPLDIWAFGVVLVELCNLKPLFPGKDLYEMLNLQLKCLGSPSAANFGGPWHQEAGSKAERSILVLTQRQTQSKPQLIGNQHFKVFDKVAKACLRWDPLNRPSPEQLLHYIHSHGQQIATASNLRIATQAKDQTTDTTSSPRRLSMHGRSHSIA